MQHPKARGGTTGSNTKPRTLGAKAVDPRWQRAPTSEKKRGGRVPELEIQLAQLQEELKNTKDKLNEAESRTTRAYHEAEEAKKQVATMSAKLDESQKQLDELWACEESRIQELRKVSHDRDRAWESELKAVQKHLATTINENQNLNIRLQKVAESEAAHARHAESAQLELSETVNAFEELKMKLNESKDAESRANELVSKTREQLEVMKLSVEKDECGEAERAVELASALTVSAELEEELKKLKVQTEQWRKAAEVAAAMVLGEGGKFVSSFEVNNDVGDKSNSSYFEDIVDDTSVKKTSNMLKKFGVLLKKGQK